MESNEMITSDPKIMMGKPTLKGTRITVEYILEELKAGKEIQDLLQAHQFLTKEKIQSAIAYALAVLKNEDVYVYTRKNA